MRFYKGEFIMYIENKNKIIVALTKLDYAIENGADRWFIKDPKYPSLYLWSKHLEYLHEVFALYDNESDYKKLADIYDFLEIERVCIQANTDYNENKKQLEDYIRDITKKLTKAI